MENEIMETTTETTEIVESGKKSGKTTAIVIGLSAVAGAAVYKLASWGWGKITDAVHKQDEAKARKAQAESEEEPDEVSEEE